MTFEGNIGLDNIGLVGSWIKGNQTSSWGIRVNLSEFKVGIEYFTTIQLDKSSQMNYTNISVSGWWIYIIYSAVTNGQSVQQPSY